MEGTEKKQHSSRWWASIPESTYSPYVESRFTQHTPQPGAHPPDRPGLQSAQSESQLQAWLGSVHLWLPTVSITDLSGTNKYIVRVFFYYVHLFEIMCMSKHTIHVWISTNFWRWKSSSPKVPLYFITERKFNKTELKPSPKPSVQY